MENNVLLDIAKKLAVDITTWCDKKENAFMFKREFLKCGLMLGALIYEAQFIQKRKIFMYNLELALNQCSQLEYWLELLKDTNKMDKALFKTLKGNAELIRKTLLKICIKEKNKKHA